MRSFFLTIGKVYEYLLQTLVHIGVALVLAAVLLISASVFLRRTEFAIGWALEVSEYIIIIVTFFGAGWVLRTGKHVRVDLITNIGPAKFQLVYNGFLYLVVAFVCLVITVVGFSTAWDAYRLGTLQVKMFTFPKWTLISVIPLGTFFLFVEAVSMSLRYLKQLRNEPGHSR